MKRGLALLWLILLLAGCSQAKRTTVDAAQLLSRPFSSEVRLDWNGVAYAGSINRDTQGGLTLSLTGDDLSIPITFTCETGGCVIAQGELTLTLQEQDLPSTSLVSSLRRAFVLLQSAPVQEGEGELAFQSGAARLTCQKEGLAFSRLELEQGQIEFTQFDYVDL